jgi:hypothetical protein
VRARCTRPASVDSGPKTNSVELSEAGIALTFKQLIFNVPIGLAQHAVNHDLGISFV